MNKVNFIALLRSKLYDLPYNEVEKIIEYYNEFIEDALESGKSEDEVIDGLGDINLLINKLRADLSFETAIKKPSLSNGMKVLIAVMGVMSLPIVLPIAGAIFAVLVAIISVGIALLVALVAVIVAVIGLIIGSISANPGDPAMIALLIGISLVAIGVITLLFTGFMAILRLIIKGLLKLGQVIYKSFSNRGKNKV